MCRHLAYLGPVVPLRTVLTEPPYSLLRQSWAPRRQAHGLLNADGFGVGWYADGDPVPARYRSDRPMWADPSLPDLARVVRTSALLGAVRSATVGLPYAVDAAAPFAGGPHLFSHNGVLPGYPESVANLAAELSPVELLRQPVSTDSTLLWALVRRRLDAGARPADALADVVRRAASVGGRLNLLLTDGATIAATTWGDKLCWRADDRGVVVASEPFDDDAGWHDVPDRSLLTASRDGVTVVPIVPDDPETP